LRATTILLCVISGAGGAQENDRCRVDVVRRWMLSPAPGYELYVEPTVLVPSGSELLLAGLPSYLFRREADTTRLVARDSIFGAVIHPDGSARAVPFPFAPVPASDVRALPRAGGGWIVTFAELPPSPIVPNDGPVVRLWRGEFDGRSWSAIAQLPIPSDLELRTGAASSLVRSGDTLLWAFPSTRRNGGWGASLYVGHGPAWSQEAIPLRGAAYVAVGISDSLGVLLLAVHTDSTLRHDRNSLFLYARRPQWTPVRKLAAGNEEPVHFPELVADPSSAALTLTWHAIVQDGDRARWEARAMIGRPDLRREPVVVLDSSVARGWASTRVGARQVWLIDHADAQLARELRVVEASGRGATVLGGLPYPFDGTFNAAGTGTDELLLAGPLRGEPPRDAGVATLLMRVRLACDGGAR
jgi:hypothetical protein